MDRRRAGARAIVSSGAGAGLAAAVAMAIAMVIVSAASGRGVWTPLELVGALAFGAAWQGAPVASAIVGIVVHLVVGTAWGVLFAGATQRVESSMTTFMLGVLYATGIFLFMTYTVMPWLDPTMFEHLDQGRFFISHVLYGSVLALVLARVRSRARPVSGARRFAQ